MRAVRPTTATCGQIAKGPQTMPETPVNRSTWCWRDKFLLTWCLLGGGCVSFGVCLV